MVNLFKWPFLLLLPSIGENTISPYWKSTKWTSVFLQQVQFKITASPKHFLPVGIVQAGGLAEFNIFDSWTLPNSIEYSSPIIGSITKSHLSFIGPLHSKSFTPNSPRLSADGFKTKWDHFSNILHKLFSKYVAQIIPTITTVHWILVCSWFTLPGDILIASVISMP